MFLNRLFKQVYQYFFNAKSLNSVLNIILNASLVKYGGDLALSAIGIVTSIQTLILMPITGLMQGQQPLISYNYGALKMDRVKETLKYAIIGATMIALIGFIAVQFFTKSIVYMFNDEADVVKLCSHALLYLVYVFTGYWCTSNVCKLFSSDW